MEENRSSVAGNGGEAEVREHRYGAVNVKKGMKRAPAEDQDENRTRMREWLRAQPQAVLVDEPSRVMTDVAAMANAADVMVLSEHHG
eukprot:4034803-Prymnesium_polylepis.1